jgi:hypothetical protein
MPNITGNNNAVIGASRTTVIVNNTVNNPPRPNAKYSEAIQSGADAVLRLFLQEHAKHAAASEEKYRTLQQAYADLEKRHKGVMYAAQRELETSVRQTPGLLAHSLATADRPAPSQDAAQLIVQESHRTAARFFATGMRVDQEGNAYFKVDDEWKTALLGSGLFETTPGYMRLVDLRNAIKASQFSRRHNVQRSRTVPLDCSVTVSPQILSDTKEAASDSGTIALGKTLSIYIDKQ